MNAGADLVHGGLQFIHVFVQPVIDDLVHRGEREIGAKLAEQFFRGMPEGAEGRAGNGVERIARRQETVLDGAGKFAVQEQKFDDAARGNAAVALAIHLESRGGAEDGGPADVVERLADFLDGAEEDVVFDIEDAGGFVGAFEHAAELAEVPGFAVGHRRVRQAAEEVGWPF